MRVSDFVARTGYGDTQSPVIQAGGNSGVIISEMVSGANSLLVTHFSNSINRLAAWGYVTWTVQINGIPVPGYEAIEDQLGDNPQMWEFPEPILVRGGDLFEVVATNNSPDINPDTGNPFLDKIGVSVRGVYGTPRS